MTIVFGNIIKAARENLGLQQHELAIRSELPLNLIIKLEAGLVDPGLNEIMQLANALDMPASQLFMRMENAQEDVLE